jgi:hypothetical protein
MYSCRSYKPQHGRSPGFRTYGISPRNSRRRRVSRDRIHWPTLFKTDQGGTSAPATLHITVTAAPVPPTPSGDGSGTGGGGELNEAVVAVLALLVMGRGCGRADTLGPHRIDQQNLSQVIDDKRSFGAGKEARTPDLNLGKVALYQLSYSRAEPRRNCRAVKPGVKKNPVRNTAKALNSAAIPPYIEAAVLLTGAARPPGPARPVPPKAARYPSVPAMPRASTGPSTRA